MREAEIEKILVNEVKRLGGRAYKWVSPGNDGVPDRIVIFPNKPPVFVELKTDRGKLSELQKIQCKNLSDLGQHVEVVHGLSGLAFFFKCEGFPEAAVRIEKRMKSYG